MFKLSKLYSLCFLLLVFPSFIFAADDTMTITTYYPSPYGTYNQIGTNKLAVGYTASNEQPNITGDIRLYPQSGIPTSWSAGKQGEIGYASTDGYLYVYNGSTWVKQGGGGGCYVSYSGGCLSGFTNMGSAGNWGACHYDGDSYRAYCHFRPPGGGCISGWTSRNLGEAYVCCQ